VNKECSVLGLSADPESPKCPYASLVSGGTNVVRQRAASRKFPALVTLMREIRGGFRGETGKEKTGFKPLLYPEWHHV
jgi:hypothetical protein